ncbi:MAG TPA: TIGR00282 family metallophosphoesterase [Actinobacteria bacterium]|nr:TIGR00282 family metallophosphoesterase [Actinomycetota bacterium]
MKVLFLGDVIGKPGRNALRKKLDRLIRQNEADMVIANGENSSGGIGISIKTCKSLFEAGVDVVTTGNHIFKKREIYNFLDEEPNLLKPANYPPDTPGRGYNVYEIEKLGGLKVAVINLCGRVFIDNLDCPFRTVDRILEHIGEETPIIIVDIHAEVTSEKVAMGWFLNSRVSAVIGTHTHIQTADERILPGGITAYITDAGMVGPRDSVIGVKKENIIEKFITCMPQKFTVSKNDVWINGVVIDIDEKSGKARDIKRINCAVDDGHDIWSSKGQIK